MISGAKSGSYQTLVGFQGSGTSQRRLHEMCIVFKHKSDRSVRFEDDDSEEVVGRALRQPSAIELSEMQMWKQRRESIVKSLENCGLSVFCHYSRDRDDIVCKIGAGGAKLKDVAARTKYKLRLKPEYLGAHAEYRNDFGGRPELQFTDRRVVSYLYETHTQHDAPTDDAIFSDLDKILLVHHMITSKDKECAGIEVGALLHKGEIKAYFPLHDTDKLKEIRVPPKWYDAFLMGEEHANRIREYFGDRVAFYFLFMSFYAKWLVPLAVVGFVKQSLDLLARTPDNFTATPFCILLSVWCTLLPHFWKRQEAKLAINWGTLDTVEKLAPCRAEHWGEPRLNPVTSHVEPYYPLASRIWNYACSGVAVVFTGILVVLVMCLLLFYRHTSKTTVVGGVVGMQFLLALVVETVNLALSVMARQLTKMENHRTQSEHDLHELVKLMGFKFVNSYVALYYIGFFKNHNELLGSEMVCLRGDCLLDLQSQLGVFVLFRLIIQNAVEVLSPRAKLFMQKLDQTCRGQQLWTLVQGHRMELADMSSAEQQSKQELYSTFADFDETLITHGYATLFAVSSPWVCFATLFGTIFEMYIDLRKVTDAKQRPIPVKCRGADPWVSAFEIYGAVAAFTNLLLLIFTSEQYSAWTNTEKVTFFLFLEHLVLLSRLLVQWLLPAKPKSVVLLQMRQDHIAHRCLENIKLEPSQDFGLFRESRHDAYEIFDHDVLEDEDVDGDEPQWASLGNSSHIMYRGIAEELPLQP